MINDCLILKSLLGKIMKTLAIKRTYSNVEKKSFSTKDVSKLWE